MANTQTKAQQQLPETGFVRLWNIVGSQKRGIVPLIPIGRTTFLEGVKSGKYPRPIKLGPRTLAWRVSDIRRLIKDLEAS